MSPLHPLLASRFSPTHFDRARDLTEAEVQALIEAARWAPSAGNSQPWAFIVGCRGSDVHARLVAHLAGSSARWAPDASLLMANLAHVRVEGTDWPFSEFAYYDLGQAVAHMTIQAQALGLRARQFRAFNRNEIAQSFNVPAHWEVVTMTAFGAPKEAPPRPRRRDTGDLLWSGSQAS